MNSVIIPADNEAKVLPRTLEHLSQQEGEFEVPAVDGGSTDATREVLAGFPLVRVLAAPKGWASQMNGGVADAGHIKLDDGFVVNGQAAAQ